MYKIEPQLQEKIKALLLHSSENQPLHYDTYSKDKTKFDLSILINNRMQNKHGFEIKISVDFVRQMPDRDNPKQLIRFFSEYQLQYLSDVRSFNNHLIIFGPKIVDKNLKKAIKHQIEKENEAVLDPFILIAVNFQEMDKLLKQFPNLKHFCIKNIPDDRTKGVVVRGHRLEETDLFDRFALDADTRGPINFIAITTNIGKIIYLGKDGSIYSRMSFEKENTVKIVYSLYLQLQKSKALKNVLS